MRTTLLTLALLSTASTVANEEAHHVPHGPHHLSVFLGDTHVDGEGNNLTLGVDYEYRLSPLLGAGIVAEYAYGELDAWTVLAVADIHLMNGLILQIGPGFEHREGEEEFVGRIGALYEFEFKGGYTLSPQLHYDYHDGSDAAVVFGFAFGMAF